MKKPTIGIIGILLVLMLSGSAWAQSGLRIDLGGNGFGFTISDGHSGLSAYSYAPYRPYPYNYSGYYPNRPYLGWGGYREHHHHKPQYWGHQRSGHHRKNHYYGHQRGHKRDSYGEHRRKHRRQGHHAQQWRR